MSRNFDTKDGKHTPEKILHILSHKGNGNMMRY